MTHHKVRLGFAIGGRERGFTLVELMIAMLLALLLIAGAIRVFIGNRATYAFNDGLSRVQENARFALDHIANDVRMTGYVGCLANLGVNNNLDTPDDFRDDLENGIQGFDYAGGDFAATAVNPANATNEGAWEPDLPAAYFTDDVIPGSDVLVLRHVGTRASTLVSPFSDATTLYPEDASIFQQGEILVATDCQKATIFKVTNDPAMTGTLEHASGGFTPGNAFASWPTEQSYGLGSEVATLETVVFYVGRGANGSPTLFQRRLTRDPMDATTTIFSEDELVDGIETMQVRYGVDSDNNNDIDDWQTADVVDAASDWDRVRAVEISLLSRAAEEYGQDVDSAEYTVGDISFDPVDDRRFRRVFSTVIGMRNRLP